METQERIPIESGKFIPVRAWLPSGKPRSIVVALHGQITHAGWFTKLGELLSARGIGLLAPDRRGNGLAQHLTIPNGAETLISDVGLAIDLAKTKCDDVTLLCWCFGAKIGLPAALQFQKKIKRVVLPSPSLIAAPEMAARLKKLVPENGFYPIHFDPITEFSDVPEVQKFIANDAQLLKKIPVSQREISNALSSVAIEAVGKISVSILSVLADQDIIIDVLHTEEILKNTTLKWFKGGHGFVIEPGGPEILAKEIDAFSQ